jgi:protein-S-isoprenylcysteine O-methyltransferase Ste14
VIGSFLAIGGSCAFWRRFETVKEERTMFVKLANFTERWVLSVVFFCLAAREFTKLWGAIYWQHDSTQPPRLVDVSNHAILFLLGLFTTLLLLIARKPSAPPERLKFVVVPLVTTFYTVFYYAIGSLPESLKANLAPTAWQRSLIVAGWVCIVVGPAISLWGILYLGRSFGVFVTVRKVVLGGPYRWVRHPMYLGWVCICLGAALSNFSIGYFAVTGVHVALLAYRARLEERQLEQHSPEYREYMKSSGFILPRFRRARS